MPRKNKEDYQQFEDLSSYSSSKEYKKRRKNRRARAVLRGVGVFFCLLFILFGSGLVYVSTGLISGLTTTTIAKDDEALGIDPENIVMDDSVRNIALFGVDSRNGEFTGLSDVIMILTVDNKHGKIKMTSILRDSEVTIEGESFNQGYLNYVDKINAAYYYGGPELAIRTLNQNFSAEGSSLNIRDYVTINFANMAAIVDAFGGVDMEMTAEEVYQVNQNLWALSQEVEDKREEDEANGIYNETYAEITSEDYIPDIYGEINILYGEYEDGTYHLNGNQAVAYGRIRKIDSDWVRVERQQKVLSALVEKLTGMGITDYTSLISQLMPYCETSLDLGDIVSMTPILFTDFTMSSISVPDPNYEYDLFDGNDEYGNYHMQYDPAGAAPRISAFIWEDDSPYWEQYGDTSQEGAEEGLASSGGNSSQSYSGGYTDGGYGYTDSGYDYTSDSTYQDTSGGYSDGYSDSDSSYGGYTDSDSTGDGYTDGAAAW